MESTVTISKRILLTKMVLYLLNQSLNRSEHSSKSSIIKFKLNLWNLDFTSLTLILINKLP